MREFKFRVWDNEMQSFNDNRDINLYTDFPDNITHICYFVNASAMSGINIQQFTGLRDKNKKEIYEGDIVKIDINMGISTKIVRGEVKFIYGKFIFDNFKKSKKIIIDRTAHRYDSFDIGDFGETSIEVIGNIYENKELLCL